MRQLILLILASLFASSAAGAAQPERGPLHPKSAAGLMPPAYLASQSERSRLRPSNGGDLKPFAALALDGPSNAAAAQGGLASIGSGASLLRLGWGPALTVAQTVTVQSEATALAAGDLTGDGRPDLAAIQRPANQLALARGQSGGALAAPTQRAVAAEAEALLADDLNADCRPDLAYVTPSGVSTLLQGPGGALAPSLILPFANVGMADLAAGDLNYDGQPDLAALRGTGSSTRQLDLFTMRRGVLAAKQDRAVADGGFAAHSVAIGDVTNDGRADLVVGAGGNMPEALINIFAQNADGTLPTAPRTLDAWHIPEAVAVADINHDGYNDIVALHSGWLALTVYPGSADGPLSAYDTYTLPYSTAYRPEALALGDLNGDGGLDVLIADGERGATYLINSAGAPRSSITAPADCGVVRSSAFTITGVLTNATELEVSLDGGRTWEAATVDGTSWEYKATLGAEWVYPVIMARGRNGDRVQAPAATRRMVFQHQRLALPIVIKQ